MGMTPSELTISLHNRLKRLVGKAHRNIYKFVEVLQREQTATEVSLTQLEARVRPPRRAQRAVNRDRKIKEHISNWKRVAAAQNATLT